MDLVRLGPSAEPQAGSDLEKKLKTPVWPVYSGTVLLFCPAFGFSWLVADGTRTPILVYRSFLIDPAKFDAFRVGDAVRFRFNAFAAVIEIGRKPKLQLIRGGRS